MNAQQCTPQGCTPQQSWQGSGSCSDDSCSSSCGSSYSSKESPLATLMCAAKEAKHQLMVEKIKGHLDQQIGDKMDQAAGLAADMLMECWNMKMSASSKKEEAMKKFKEIVTQ